MKIVKSQNYRENLDKAAEDLLVSLETNTNAMLLLSGGSSLVVSEVVFAAQTSFSKLAIGQIDERFGQPEHNNSNWNGIKQLGNLENYKLYPVLKGSDAAATAKSYSDLLEKLLNEKDYSVGVLGMGQDGHIAGILPDNTDDFSRFLSDELVVEYQAKDFDRITVTDSLLARLDKIILFANGIKKADAVARLQSDDEPAHEWPAQLLKKYKDVTIYVSDNE